MIEKNNLKVMVFEVGHILCFVKSFKSEMEWAPFKGLFWNTNDSVVKLMLSITNGVSS